LLPCLALPAAASIHLPSRNRIHLTMYVCGVAGCCSFARSFVHSLVRSLVGWLVGI
jgi:hypothetical protein